MSAVAILSLALGIGATTAVFSILDAVLLRSLPVREPSQLFRVSVGADQTSLTNPVWEAIRDRQEGVFQGAAVWSTGRFDLAQGGESTLVNGLYTNGAFFETLGVTARLGRVLTPADDQRGGGPGGPVAVISFSFWQNHYGGVDDVVGKTLVVQRVPFTIVGVAARGFTGPDVGRSFDLAIPIGAEILINGEDSGLDQRSYWWLDVVGRLAPGVSRADAATRLNARRDQIRQATMPDDWRPEELTHYLGEDFVLQPAASGTSSLRRRYADPLKVMMGVVVLVLLIACANIANLLLARAAARRRELSVRLALGASRLRLAGQLFSESMILALLGASAGLLVAHWGSALLVSQLSTQANTVFLDVSLDWRLLSFAVVVSMATAVVFGTVPAWRAGRIDAGEALLAQSRSSSGEARRGVAGALVVAQVALSLVLVAGAGMFVRTFTGLTTQDLGFDQDSLLVARINAQRSGLDSEARVAHYERLREAVAAVPGVVMASASVITPVSGATWQFRVEVPDRPDLPKSDAGVWVNYLQPGWFETYRTALVAGRDFAATDRSGATPVAILNETAASRLFGEDLPLGRTLRQPGRPGVPAKTMEIVGVVRDATYRSLRDPAPPTLYLPLAQQDEPPLFLSLSMRTGQAEPLALSRAVADAIQQVDGNMSVTFRSLDEQVSAALIQERLLAMLSGFFGLLALLLAGLGLYGVTAYAVNRRRLEVGIRMALGATPHGVVILVLRRVAVLLCAGILAGGLISYWAAALVGSLTWGIEPRDPALMAGAAAVLALVGATAGWIPARRAARVDPARVLNAEG